MESAIKSYIESELKKLDNREVKSIELEGVYPSVLQSILGTFGELDTNGWQADYWTNTERYEVSGCMYYGKATISLREGE
ncbi:MULTISPECIES: hypothetical protein [Bacillus cereus group]|uniref:hypothetical protein n=1 Tax=Bacillus cereus group TaxID=86661 RepID=UPI00065BFDB5|nr:MULTISPECIES: hypothetical protein [Bacillus cereus group]KMP65148.1 hypothetical protein TU57_10345 [Bacillus cereus]MDX6046674.1 hypothetical protein [Bacillus paranthracis]